MIDPLGGLFLGLLAGILHAGGLALRDRPLPTRYLGVALSALLGLGTWAAYRAQAAYASHSYVTGTPGGGAWEAAAEAALGLGRPTGDWVVDALSSFGWGFVLALAVAFAWRSRTLLAALPLSALFLVHGLWRGYLSGDEAFLQTSLTFFLLGASKGSIVLVAFGGAAEVLDAWLLQRREVSPPPSLGEVMAALQNPARPEREPDPIELGHETPPPARPAEVLA